MTHRLILFFILVSSCGSSDKSETKIEPKPIFEIKSIAVLDSTLTESSGIVEINQKLYTHSDVSGTVHLLELNIDGAISNALTFENAITKDWEDVAINDTHLYIADIGNNLANRKDLRVFKIPRSQLDNPQASIETINFSLNDQTDFGNGAYNKTSYDIEALTVRDKQLYIFTKDWINLNTNIYKIDNKAGSYELEPLTTLNIGGLVTGATTNPEGDIILCGYSATLSPFVAQISFNNGLPKIKRKINLAGMLGAGAQIEGITYFGIVDGIATYYLTSEAFTTRIAGTEIKLPAHLYEMKWNE